MWKYRVVNGLHCLPLPRWRSETIFTRFTQLTLSSCLPVTGGTGTSIVLLKFLCTTKIILTVWFEREFNWRRSGENSPKYRKIYINLLFYLKQSLWLIYIFFSWHFPCIYKESSTRYFFILYPSPTVGWRISISGFLNVEIDRWV